MLVWKSGDSVELAEEITTAVNPNVVDMAFRFGLYLRTLNLVRDIIKEARSEMLGETRR